MSKKEEILICECNSIEHSLIFKYDTDPNWEFVYVDIHLSKRNGFWERLKYGIKYIFGYKCRFGAFDEIILKTDDIHKLKNIVKYLEEVKKHKET